MRYQAAAVQYESVLLDKERNLRDLVKLTREAAARGATLIALPEMCTTGYYFDCRAEVERLAEPIPGGETTQLFLALAKELNCYIVAGIAEREGTKLFNAAFLVGPEGYWGSHRKIHPYVPDALWAKNGDRGIQVFDTPIGKISIHICMDISYPESVRVAKAMGAQIIIGPSNWCETVMPSAIWITRAIENQVYMVIPNRQGTEKGFEFSGYSSIISPTGEVLASLPRDNGIIMGCIDLGSSPVSDEIPERRPDLYQDLQLQHYPWTQNLFHLAYAHPTLPEGGRLKIGVAQIQAVRGNVQESLRGLGTLAKEAKAKAYDVLTAPELLLGGRPDSQNDAETIALTTDGPEVTQLRDMAGTNGLTVCCGFILREAGKLYNAAICATPDGRTLFYRKSHLSSQEKSWATPGDMPGAYIDIPKCRLGLLVGSEILVPEISRILANQGCDAIMVPSDLRLCCSSLPGYPEEICHWHIGRVRGNENNTYIMFANQREHSGVFGPDMFTQPLDEIILDTCGSLGGVLVDTRQILYNEATGTSNSNPVREKLMLITRQPLWYDALFQ